MTSRRVSLGVSSVWIVEWRPTDGLPRKWELDGCTAQWTQDHAFIMRKVERMNAGSDGTVEFRAAKYVRASERKRARRKLRGSKSG